MSILLPNEDTGFDRTDDGRSLQADCGAGGSARSYNLALLAQLRKLKPPFNNRVGPSENVYRGLPCPRLLAQYFEPVPRYGLAVCDDGVIPGHHPRFITVQLHLRDLLIKGGGAGIKELLVMLLDF